LSPSSCKTSGVSNLIVLDLNQRVGKAIQDNPSTSLK
jgi:hypothetical protein